jgi:DNA polymerase elongation subunit (family B)
LRATNRIWRNIEMYVDGFYDRDEDIIRVVERDSKGQRQYKDYAARHVFYYSDPKGKYQSIKGEPLSRVTCKNIKELRKELAIHSNKRLYESDINPIYRCLEDNYLNADAPNLNIAFFDIEVDFDPERGYAAPDDAFMPITAIAVHLQWLETLVCLAIPPKTMSMAEAERAVSEFPNTMLFSSEADMLDAFLNLIEDADVLSGWNSEGFDIPYTVNRVAKVLSKDDTRRFCLWNQYPKKREYEKFGKSAVTYDLIGRVHLDSLEMYRKYTYEERHTYRLDAIGEMEVGESKTVYEGTLDQLYNNDFKKFIEYNRQDTALLDKLDKKLRFIDLANKLAHDCTVLLQTTMGAVAVTEQAIINEAHRRGMQVPNRKRMEEQGDTQAAGAYVAYPKKGIHEWIGSLDINSLYPSAIRALNMGPETIIGQLRQDGTKDYIAAEMGKGKSFAAAWEGIFGSLEYTAVMDREVGREITIDWEDGGSDTLSAAQIYDLIFDSNQPWMLSANGTIFTYEKEGIIPGLLARWYKERKEMQAKLKDAIAAGNKIEEEYWDKRQLVKKINLNSLYGAILNPGCRFFDNRIGQSTTLTGRAVARHMAGKVNEIITGEYDHVGKAIIYGDTDSCYFSAYTTLKKDIERGAVPWTRETVVELYDTIGETVNGTFVKFMSDAFHCPKTEVKSSRQVARLLLPKDYSSPKSDTQSYTTTKKANEQTLTESQARSRPWVSTSSVLTHQK